MIITQPFGRRSNLMHEEWEPAEIDENDVPVELVNVSIGRHENLIAFMDEESKKIVFLKDILDPEEIVALERDVGFFDTEFFIPEERLAALGMTVGEIASHNGGIVQVTPLVPEVMGTPEA